MRIFGIALAAALLAGCASAPGESTLAQRVEVYPTEPSEPIALEDQQVLFWDDATRADRFRRMENFFAGIEATHAGTVRELPEGSPLPAEVVAAVDAFLASSNAAGIMVIDDGKVRYEKYGLGFGPEQRWTSFSVAKSFTSTLLGAAVAEGLIGSMDDPVTRYIPKLAGTAYEGVSVEQLATMTSGVKWNEDYTDPESDVAKMLNVAPVPGESQAVTYARTLEREAPAGEKWVYKTLETNLLGVLVEEATGRSLADYAKEKIVDPAGFAGDLFWMTDLTGGNIGGCCLSIRLSDYARFGQFVLEGGEGVVPPSWFAEATGKQVAFDTPGFGYGYQWWTYPGAYGAQGIFGQAITIVPEDRLVVAVVSNWPVASSRDLRFQWGEVVQTIAAAD